MNMISKWLAALALLAGAVVANAATVSVSISGQLTDIGSTNGLVSSDLAIGETYKWSFSYNTNAQLGGNAGTILSSNLTIGSFSWGSGSEGIADVLQIGGTQATVGPFDQYDFEVVRPSGPNLAVNGNAFYPPGTFQWSVSAPPVLEGDFPSAIVPTAAQLLNAVSTTNGDNDYTTFNWSQEFVTGSVGSVQINDVTTSPVSLPSAGWLFISGFGALAVGAKRRRPESAA